jgi:hypothetical protein
MLNYPGNWRRAPEMLAASADGPAAVVMLLAASTQCR